MSKLFVSERIELATLKEKLEIVLFVLLLYVPVSSFSVMSERLPVFLGRTSTKQRIKCLAQEHNTVSPVSLELVGSPL